MAEAKRDNNQVTTLLAVSNVDGVTPVVLWADPTTHRLLVSSTVGNLDDIGDVVITGGAQGDILYHNGTNWVNLAAGASGKYLKTQGAGANPMWDTPTAVITGTDTQVLFFDGANNPVGDATFTFNKTSKVATITGLILSGLTASQLVATDGSKNLVSLAVATYPSLTEISYVKGLTSSVQTQLDAKVAKSLFDAHTIIYATTDNTPAALTVTEQTLVGRLTGGNITAVAIGIADNNILQVDDASAADNDYAKFTANGIEGVPYSTVLSDIGALPLAGGTMSGNITLGENTAIALDPAGSADGKYSGITVTGTAGATVAFGDLITLDKDDSRWELVDISAAAAATGDARGVLGMAVSAGNDGDGITILLMGIIRADANFPALTIGANVYASTTGDIVVTQPTTTDYVIRIVGAALTADEIFFRPDFHWITHT